jgi:hypothetical protein
LKGAVFLPSGIQLFSNFNSAVYGTVAGFRVLVEFVYMEDESIIEAIEDLDQLFEIYKLADKVSTEHRLP